MINSRAKGAAFERMIAAMLYDELGIKFKRDLEQYRQSLHGDLICELESFPFVIECKKRAAGTTYSKAWFEQAEQAAKHCKKIPCLVYQINRSPVRCVVDLNVIIETFGGHTIHHENLVELSMSTFCMIAREMIQPNPMSDKNSVQELANLEYQQ